jgi:hypothetical protein
MEEKELNNEAGPVEKEYKGHPLLVLNPESKYPFSFGLAKAKLVIEYFDRIKEFIAKHDK